MWTYPKERKKYWKIIQHTPTSRTATSETIGCGKNTISIPYQGWQHFNLDFSLLHLVSPTFRAFEKANCWNSMQTCDGFPNLSDLNPRKIKPRSKLKNLWEMIFRCQWCRHTISNQAGYSPPTSTHAHHWTMSPLHLVELWTIRDWDVFMGSKPCDNTQTFQVPWVRTLLGLQSCLDHTSIEIYWAYIWTMDWRNKYFRETSSLHWKNHHTKPSPAPVSNSYSGDHGQKASKSLRLSFCCNTDQTSGRFEQLGTWRLLQSSSLFKIGGGLEPAQLQLAKRDRFPHLESKVCFFLQMAKRHEGFHEIGCRIALKICAYIIIISGS